MKRILFVDDEQAVLDGLRRTLRPQRRRWEMVFASSGEDALREVEAAEFHAVLTDLQMPGMDGAELLTKIRERHPRAIRLILSGHAEFETVMSSVHVAHQLLSKPCEPDALRAALSRVCELEEILPSEDLRAIVGELAVLPSRPELCSALSRALGDSEVELAAVAEILEQDPGMSAKVLQAANSSFLAPGQQITQLEQAVLYLGVNKIRELVHSLEVFRPPDGCSPDLVRFVCDVPARSQLTARLARRLVGDEKLDDCAYTAGLLHDVGTTVLAAERPQKLDQALCESRERGEPLHVTEERIFGASHAEVGAYLLGLWGLPDPIVACAAAHHDPSKLSGEGCDVLAAIHVADCLVDALWPGGANRAGAPARIDLAWLEKVGASERLPEWQALAEEELGRAAGDQDDP